MNRRRLGIWAVAAALLVAATVSAQNVDFSGDWTPDIPKSRSTWPPSGGASSPRGGFYANLRITQDARTLTVQNMSPSGEQLEKEVFHLDGTASRHPEGRDTFTSEARWDHSRLVIDTKYTRPGPMEETMNRSAWYFEGTYLVHEIQIPIEDAKPSPNHRKWYYARMNRGR